MCFGSRTFQVKIKKIPYRLDPTCYGSSLPPSCARAFVLYQAEEDARHLPRLYLRSENRALRSRPQIFGHLDLRHRRRPGSQVLPCQPGSSIPEGEAAGPAHISLPRLNPDCSLTDSQCSARAWEVAFPAGCLHGSWEKHRRWQLDLSRVAEVQPKGHRFCAGGC